MRGCWARRPPHGDWLKGIHNPVLYRPDRRVDRRVGPGTALQRAAGRKPRPECCHAQHPVPPPASSRQTAVGRPPGEQVVPC
jgi:hypothetical protein